MKFVVGENGRNPDKNIPRPRFVHHETHMEGPRRELGTAVVGSERLTACATRPLIVCNNNDDNNNNNNNNDRLFGMEISTSDCYPRFPGSILGYRPTLTFFWKYWVSNRIHSA